MTVQRMMIDCPRYLSTARLVDGISSAVTIKGPLRLSMSSEKLGYEVYFRHDSLGCSRVFKTWENPTHTEIAVMFRDWLSEHSIHTQGETNLS